MASHPVVKNEATGWVTEDSELVEMNARADTRANWARVFTVYSPDFGQTMPDQVTPEGWLDRCRRFGVELDEWKPGGPEG